jgi:hypothetical protein
LLPSRQLDYSSAAALRIANAAHVNAATVDKGHLPDARSVGRGWYELPQPLPRARLVAESVTTTEPAIDVDRIDVERVALTTHDLELSGGDAGRANMTLDDPGRLRIETEASGRQLLVVSESFDDGWTARIDDQPAAVERVYGDFLGVVVPAGSHNVALEFQPGHLAVGRWISAVSAALALILLIGGGTLRR